MVEINYQNLPKQQGFKIDVQALGGYELHPDTGDTYDEEGLTRPEVVTRPFGSNEFHLSIIKGSPGSGLPWHTHTPSTYQIYMPLEGRAAVSYKDNDGEVHRVEADPDEMVYLPPGAHNRIEIIGDENAKILVVDRETNGLVGRVEQLVGDQEDLYDPKDAEYGLQLDTMRGDVVMKDDEAVTEY